MFTATLFRTNLGDEYVEPTLPRFHERARAVSSHSFRILKDGDSMPFGRYRGQPMLSVPADYLDGLRDESWVGVKYPAVAEYIERCSKAIDQDLDRDERRDWAGL